MTRSMVLQSIAISPRTTTSAAPCCGYPRIDRLRGSGWGAPRACWPDTGRPPLRRWCLRSVSRASSHGRLGGSPSALDLFWLSAGDILQGFCVGCGARWWVFPRCLVYWPGGLYHRVVVLRRGHRDLPGSCRRTGDATTVRPQSTQEGIGSPLRLAVCSPSCTGSDHLLYRLR